MSPEAASLTLPSPGCQSPGVVSNNKRKVYESDIATPTAYDVLCGRGKGVNNHEGNIRFRDVVRLFTDKYHENATSKVQKSRITTAIVSKIRSLSPPGRFLEQDEETKLWSDIGDSRARRKAAQALREICKGKFESNEKKKCDGTRNVVVKLTKKRRYKEEAISLLDRAMEEHASENVFNVEIREPGDLYLDSLLTEISTDLDRMQQMSTAFGQMCRLHEPGYENSVADRNPAKRRRIFGVSPLCVNKTPIKDKKRAKIVSMIGQSEIQTMFASFKTSRPTKFFSPSA